MLRRSLWSNDQAWSFALGVLSGDIEHPGVPFGPLTALRAYLASVDLTVDGEGFLHSSSRPKVHLREDDWLLLRDCILVAWGQSVSTELGSRKGVARDLDIDWDMTRLVIGKLSSVQDVGAVHTHLAGAIATEERHSKVSNCSPNCPACGEVDTVAHRVLRCCHTQAIRDDCPVLQNLDETAALFPFVPILPASEAFVKNCMARPEVLWTPIASDMVVTLYTDGAGKNPTSSVCDTSFAVVLLEDLSNHCISSLAHDARLSGVAPPVFSVFSTGKTRGRQTVSRAELSAAIVAIGSFRNLRLVTDSTYVINTIAAVQADPRPSRWVNRPNFDLVLRLIKALDAHPGVRSIQVDKIKSHQDDGGDVQTLSDPKLIDFWRNHLADEAAGAALEADSQEALLVRDTAQAAVGFRKRHWGLVMSGVAKTVRAFPVIRADDNPRAAGREAADAQLVPVAIPVGFEPLTLPSPVILQFASPWTHTFTHALYNWAQKLCWPTIPVETRGVSLVELLISFKLETGLNVPVANPDDPGSFTLSRIKPAISDLTSLGDESRRFSSAIQSLETSLQAFVLPWSEPFFGAVTTLGYPFGMMKLSGFKVRPRMSLRFNVSLVSI